jgi:outer membrane protein OmpA-like peptidoglycan-associated protein
MKYRAAPAALAVAGLIAAATATPAAAGDVVSLQDRQPTAEDIVRGFSDGGDPGMDLPPGLMPADAGGGTVKARGIRMMDATASTAATAATASQGGGRQDGGGYAQAPAATTPSVDCSSGRAIAVSVEFALDSYALQGDAYRTLQEVAAAMNSDALRACSFVIEGHTDAQGEDAYNLHLSHQRAQAVRDFLATTVVDSARLKAVGMGERELLDTADPAAPRNRRVQFRIGG